MISRSWASSARVGRSVPGAAEHLAAAQVFDRQAAQVDRGARPGGHLLELLLVALQAAHARLESARLDLELLPQAQLAVDQRAGDHRAEAGHGEDAIDRQARPAGCGRVALAAEQVLQRRPAGRRARRAWSPSTGTIGAPARLVSLEKLLDVGLHQLEPVLVDQVALGQRDDAVA